MELATADELDRLVIAALLAHPRATNATIGQAVRSSEATVSRRIARLRRQGAVRVVGALDSQLSHRARSVFVRLRCAPGAADELARPLALWDETGSVKVLTGSVDCVAELAYTSNEHLYRLMMHRLPQFDGVMSTFSNQVIRRFSTPHGWNPGILPDDVVAALRAERHDRWDEQPEPAEVSPMSRLDERIMRELLSDGRMSWQDLAHRCEVTPSTARRRTESLMSRGFLRMRTVVEPEILGLTVNAFVWLTINPTKIGLAGEMLAKHRNVLMIAATTGDRNLCGEIAVDNDSALYDFLSETIGHLPGLLHADVAVALRTVKRAGKVVPELQPADDDAVTAT